MSPLDVVFSGCVQQRSYSGRAVLLSSGVLGFLEVVLGPEPCDFVEKRSQSVRNQRRRHKSAREEVIQAWIVLLEIGFASGFSLDLLFEYFSHPGHGFNCI